MIQKLKENVEVLLGRQFPVVIAIGLVRFFKTAELGDRIIHHPNLA
jgi:hypothetical protein